MESPQPTDDPERPAEPNPLSPDEPDRKTTRVGAATNDRRA